jgi:hypothetical protein
VIALLFRLKGRGGSSQIFMEGNFLYVKKVPNQVDSDFLGKVTKICDASLAKLLPPSIKLFNRSILPHLI